MDIVSRTILIIVISILVISIIIAIFQYRYFFKHEHFKCPNCGLEFKPEILKMIFATNEGPGKMIKCPKCGKKDYMEPIKN